MLSPIYYYMTWVVVKITLLATYAFNVIMSLSRASTRGSYSRIEGVTLKEPARVMFFPYVVIAYNICLN